jgi:NitT/TauT family transport system substrate-binding protein
MKLEKYSKSQLSRRAFLGGTLIATGAGAAFVLAGCAPQQQGEKPTNSGAPSLTPVNGVYMTALGINLSFVEVLVAKERGYFDEFGLNLDIKGGTGTASAIQAVLSNSVDFSRTAGVNAIIAAANEDAPLVAIATVRQRSQFDLVSLAEKPIKHPRDLAGKTVGVVSAGGSTENLLDMMLLSAGVDGSTVSRPITGVGTAAYELARAGQVDAWISVDTDRMIINDQMGPVHYFNSDEYAKVPSDTYNISAELLKSDSDKPARFLAGVYKAMEFASKPANHGQVVDDLLKYTPDTDRKRSLATLPALVDGWTASGTRKFLELDDAGWLSGQDLMLEAGLITKTVGIEKLVTHKYLDAAMAML